MGLWILIGLNIITKVYGYSNGIFPDVCDSMSPVHKRIGEPLILAQTTPVPFDVILEPGNNGYPTTVSLRSKSQTGFNGFMLEARERINNITVGNHSVGQFIVLDPSETRLLTCHNSAGAAVSQRNNERKTSIKVNWTTQDQNVDIIFRATYLETFDTFWKGVDTELVFPSTTTPASSTQITTTPATCAECAVIETTTQQVASTGTSKPLIPVKKINLASVGIAAISVDSFLGVLNMGLPNIFFTVLPSGPLPSRFNKVSQISCSLLCAAVEISAVVLFYVADPIQVTLVALVCVAIVINLIKLVIVCLPIGPSHELKEICDHAVKVCSVVHLIFTIAVIFVGVLEIENCTKDITNPWLLKIMIASTVWTFLFLIWDFVSSTQRNAILGRSKQGNPQNSQRWGHQSKEKKLSGAEGIVTAVSVIFIFGGLCFAVAIAVGIL